MHVEVGARVVLQTAQAQALGESKRRLQELFDTGSHKSFITSHAAGSLGLKALTKEWVKVNTFGQRAVGSNLRDVVHVNLAPVGGGNISTIEAIVVRSVKLPWRAGHEILPDNYDLSLSRMKSQVRKLQKEPAVLEEYNAVITKQIKSEVVEIVIDASESMTAHYIPHLVVIRKEAKTTKLRVVYDASAKSHKESTSLNECLMKGQSLNPLLFDIRLRFLMKRTALVGDI